MPDYSFGCKSVLPSNEWYPAITQPNVSVVTDGIREVRPNGIVDMNGDLHEVDTIVFGQLLCDHVRLRQDRARPRRRAHVGRLERQL